MEDYLESVNTVLKKLQTDTSGLTTKNASERLSEYGENSIKTDSSKSRIKTFFRQFRDLMIMVLVVSALLSRYLGEWRSAVILAIIVIFNAVVGFVQEYKADRIMHSLASLVHPFATARRDGEWRQVNVETLVPGDMVKIQEGEAVPADIRLTEVHDLSSNDFALTGESNPVKKFIQQLHHDAELGDRNNMIFMGTTLARGYGEGVVVGTGSETILGQIANLSQTTDHDMSPLQKELTSLSKKISLNVLIVGVFLFVVALLIDLSVYDSFLFALGICMSLVPQGMPAQISVALSLASARLAKKQVVVKKLSSVETLGSTTIICTDKTGTLTKNQMTVEEIFILEKDTLTNLYAVTGVGYQPDGEIISPDGLRVEHHRVQQRELFFKVGILASTAHIAAPDEEHKTWYTLGDPTEGALITLAHKAGYNQNIVGQRHKEVKILPFDSVRKRMSSICLFGDKRYLLVKGATDSILSQATHYFDGKKNHKLTLEKIEKIHHQDATWATQARRNLAFAYRDVTDLDREEMTDEELESELVFLGLVSMTDPPREEVADAIKKAQRAGISIAIITGDYALTAEAIAEKIGLSSPHNKAIIVTGAELSEMNDTEVATLFNQGNLIFSRTSPQDKLRIVTILKDTGHIVAVTGDGINDAPALKKADIGVAMGLTGTDVSKDASEMILLKDNFSHLVGAIAEGRLIFANLRKTILSSMTSNGGELFIVLISLLFTGLWGRPIAITPILILCIDLIGEMGPLTALTRDPDYGDLMAKKPRDTSHHILNTRTTPDVLIAGILMGVIPFAMFAVHLLLAGNGFQADGISASAYGIAASVSYLTLLFCQYANIMSRRVGQSSVFQSYIFSNKKLWISIAISLFLVSLLLYVPAISGMVGSGPLSVIDRGLALGGGILFLLIREGMKKFNQN